MKNTSTSAETFLEKFEQINGPDWLNGTPDLVKLLTEYGSSISENETFPNDAHSFEVFAIKDSEDSPTGKQAFIGYKLTNGNFHFVGVPFTEPK